MLEKIRSIFGRDEADRGIGFSDLGAFVEGEREALEARLERGILEERAVVEREIRELSNLVGRMKNREREAAWHPKLEKIARTSLPAFLKAMEQQLQRPLPERGEEFYQEVAGILKGCISAMKGAGKYLQGILPEEMRGVRERISTLGACLNHMSGKRRDAEERRKNLSLVDSQMKLLQALEGEERDTELRISRIEEETGAIEARERETAEMREALRISHGYAELAAMKKRVEELRQSESSLRQQRDRIVAVLLAVFRRGAAISRRQKNSRSEALLEEAIGVLEGREAGDGCVSDMLMRASSQVKKLLEDGQLVLKGREEKELFSGEGSALQEAIATLEEGERVRREREGLERMIDFSEVWQTEQKIVRTLEELDAAKRGLRRESEELVEKKKTIRSRILRQREALASAVEEHLGRKLVFQGDQRDDS
ncbi:MAG: hypothetical protein QHG99_05085 [Methanomicrobiales archaeon]|nr:hypothetical protein [Methanomicrobiales archaeon]